MQESSPKNREKMGFFSSDFTESSLIKFQSNKKKIFGQRVLKNEDDKFVIL